jgi:hypothetical protein
MFCSDLLEVLRPILVEANLLLPQGVKSGDELFDAAFEAALERAVVLIARLDNLFVMICIAHVNVRGKLIRCNCGRHVILEVLEAF